MSTTTPNSSGRPVALVTGGARGIGRAIALGLGGAGWDVAVNYARSQAEAGAVVEAIRASGARAQAIQADISTSQGRLALADQTRDLLGPIDLLVNNAGVAPRQRVDILDLKPEDFDWLLNINLKAPFFLSQLIARRMIERAAAPGTHSATSPARTIINISSISAYTASTNRGEYCISKAGLSMATALFASRLAEHAIHVYEIRPGVIATDMTAPVKQKYDQLIADGMTPIPRWGAPEDIAKAVLAIAGGAFPFSTGQIFDVDGGFHIRRL